MTTLMADSPFGLVVEHPTVESTEGDFSIVRVRPRHEKVFVRELRAEEIGYYLPLRLHKRYWHGRKREAWVPMFAGLVFVANGADGREVAADSRCVHGFVPVAQSYQPKLRRELMQLEIVLSNQPTAEAFPELIHGRKVQVRFGCDHWAAGLLGEIDLESEREVFCVRIEFMNRIVPVVDLPPELLEVVDVAA